MSIPVLPARAARRLLMEAQGLLADPDRKASPTAVEAMIQKLGFVQVDSINVLDRAHHLTLATRLRDYRANHLSRLLEQRRTLFEHWTHDAAVIPIELFRHWKPRFRNAVVNPRFARWMHSRMGDDPKKVIAQVKRRLRREGALMAKDFEIPSETKQESWWGWTPPKAALEYLWHAGIVTIAARRNFHKVYDLTERVFPDLRSLRSPGRNQQRDWACASAMDRLVVATPGELAQFWNAVPPAEARIWCVDALRRGRIVEVKVEDELGGTPRAAFAAADWDDRLARCAEPPEGVRLLSPFDPVIRDRRRLLRRFGFEHHFEGFVPRAKRRWGYYVLPLLEGDRFVGRIDPKLHRDRSVLEVKSVHWEPAARPTRARRRTLDVALAALAKRIGARDIDLHD